LVKKRADNLPPPERGTYTLILEVPKPIDSAVGALGVRHFPKGLYSYTGSALGITQNLRTRVARHLRAVKKRRWRIDYLLEHTQVLGVVYCRDNRRLECSIVQALGKKADAKVVVQGFGSSDCTQGCRAHLYHHSGLSTERLVQRVSQIYRELGCDAMFCKLRENDHDYRNFDGPPPKDISKRSLEQSLE